MDRNQLLGLIVFGVVAGGSTAAYGAGASPVLVVLFGLGTGFALVLGFGRKWYHQILETNEAQARNLRAVISIAATLGWPPLYWSEQAFSPESLQLILHLARNMGLIRVLELGSGVSTVLIAQLLKTKGGGRLVSIDHEERWAAATVADLVDRGLQAYANVSAVPFTSLEIAGELFSWYRLPELNEKFDLIIIDGPPSWQGSGLARLPALYRLRELMTANGVLVLDDANREGETEVARRWQKSFPTLHFRKLSIGRGLLIVSASTAVFDLLPQ